MSDTISWGMLRERLKKGEVYDGKSPLFEVIYHCKVN